VPDLDNSEPINTSGDVFEITQEAEPEEAEEVDAAMPLREKR
jgi:hypothetical protein